MEDRDDKEVNIQNNPPKVESKKIQESFETLESKNIINNNQDKEENKIEKIEKDGGSDDDNDLWVYIDDSSNIKEEEIIINKNRSKTVINDYAPKININIGFSPCIVENVNIFIDDTNSKVAELVIQNYECKFNFDKKVLSEFVKLVHFTPKYFEFPIFYVFKGKYDQEIHTTSLVLKDYRSFKIISKNNRIYKKLFETFKNKVDFYRYAYFYKEIQMKKNIVYEKDGWKLYNPVKEYTRQGIEFSDDKFCFSYLNKKYELCETYPSILVIPKKFDNKEIFQVAKARMKNRFPLLSYHYNNLNKNGIKSYLYRSSQIKKGGIIFKSKNLEVDYMNTIMNIDNEVQKKFIIYDCRPELNAKANTLKGAGIDDITQYKNCIKLIFGNIENVHNVKKSLKHALELAYYGKENFVEGKISLVIKNSNMNSFLSRFESTKWLEYLSAILLGSITVAKYLIKNVNVLVHCSDGWDRTTQVCCIVQMILDPYYRTIEGFAILVEKEWVSLGHKFASRNGCEAFIEKEKDSPVFIQFLHAVHQMTLQFPTAFEFNNYFLLFLCQEIYSNKYGTFLFNHEKNKVNYKASENMISIWSDILCDKNKYINDLYKPLNGTINIKGEVKYLAIWNDFFFKYDKVGIALMNNKLLDKEEYISKIKEEKSKSIFELLNVIKDNGLENLIKDNKIYKMYKDKLGKKE